MSDVDPRIVFWVAYGVGLLIVYGLLLRRRLAHWYRHHDPRAFRDAIEGIGLFLVAVAASLGITFALFARQTGIGGILSAVAASIFLVVGIYGLSEPAPQNHGNTEARRQ